MHKAIAECHAESRPLGGRIGKRKQNAIALLGRHPTRHCESPLGIEVPRLTFADFETIAFAVEHERLAVFSKNAVNPQSAMHHRRSAIAGGILNLRLLAGMEWPM